MSTATGFYLSWIRLTGPQAKPAQIDFEPGLNVIWGASETGKSFVFSCIDFMLGRSTPPKTIAELKGYTTAWLAFTERVRNTKHVLERGLQGGDFRHYSADGDDWILSDPQPLHPEHDPNRTDTISRLLLSAAGIEGAMILVGKEQGKTRQISFRDIAHLSLINEERIIAELSPVYPTGQRIAKTGELATFTFIISGTDWSGVIEAPDLKAAKATWRGKNELYEQLIADLRREVGDNPPGQNEISDRIAACDARIAEVTSKIDESNKVVAAMMDRRKTAWESAQTARSRLMVVGQLRDRFDQLHHHYESDLDRLRFISEGDFFLAQFGAPLCPFCGEPLDDHTAKRLEEEAAMGSIQDAAAEEAKKIAANIRDLEKTLASLAGEEGQLGNLLEERQRVITDAENSIRQELEPRLGADKKELADIVEARSKLQLLLSATDRLAMMTSGLAAMGNEPKQTRPRNTPKPSPQPASTYLRLLADEIATILIDWRYLKTGVVDFDEQMDLVVAGEPRRNHGKGIRAVLHSAFTIGIMKHCHKQKLGHAGLILLDSPLTSYKEKDYIEVSEDIQLGFFEYLLKLPDNQQVIVFENKQPPAVVMPRLRHIHFSGTDGVGRKGFIPE